MLRARSSPNNHRSQHGFTLVEVVVTAFITGILATGLVWAYASGVQLFQDSYALQFMYAEGVVVLMNMEDMIRRSDRISLMSAEENISVELHLPDWSGNGTAGGDVQYIFDGRSKSLRLNDGRADQNRFNIRLMPSTYQANRRSRLTDAYTLKSVNFAFAEDLMEGYQVEGFNIIRITLVMQVPNGQDTLAMVGTAMNYNQFVEE